MHLPTLLRIVLYNFVFQVVFNAAKFVLVHNSSCIDGRYVISVNNIRVVSSSRALGVLFSSIY